MAAASSSGRTRAAPRTWAATTARPRPATCAGRPTTPHVVRRPLAASWSSIRAACGGPRTTTAPGSSASPGRATTATTTASTGGSPRRTAPGTTSASTGCPAGRRQGGDQVGVDRAGLRQQQRRAVPRGHLRRIRLPAGLAVEPRLRRRPARQHDERTTTRTETNNYATEHDAPPAAGYIRGGNAAAHRLRHARRAASTASRPRRGGLRRGRALRRRRNCAVQQRRRTWPDVPWDHDLRRPPRAPASSRRRSGPTKRLREITTQVHSGAGQYRDVDWWTLRPLFPSAVTPAGPRCGSTPSTSGPRPRGGHAASAHVRRHCSAEPGRPARTACPPLNKCRVSAVSTRPAASSRQLRGAECTAGQPPGAGQQRPSAATRSAGRRRRAPPSGQRLVPQVRRRDGHRGRHTDRRGRRGDAVRLRRRRRLGSTTTTARSRRPADLERVAWFRNVARHARAIPSTTTASHSPDDYLYFRGMDGRRTARAAPSRSASRTRPASRCSTGSRSRASSASRSRTTARRSSRARSTTRGSRTMAQRAISPPTRWRTCGP